MTRQPSVALRDNIPELLLLNAHVRFAERALALRFPDVAKAGMPASQLLSDRRRRVVMM